MDTALSFFNQGWVGALLGGLGIAFGIYQIFRHTGARLAYQYMGQKLIEGGRGLLPNEVVVQFDGKPVPRLSLSQIIIWNDGRAAVRGEDISKTDPIKFSFDNDVEVLKVEIVKRTREANNSTVSADENRTNIIFNFSFLDRSDGALLRILHTSAQTSPKCFGTIVGLPKGIESFGRIPIQYRRRPRFSFTDSERTAFNQVAAILALSIFEMRRPMFFVFGVIGIFVIAISIFPEILKINKLGLLPSIPERILIGGLGFTYALAGISLIWTERRRFPASLTPDELAEDRDDKPINQKPSTT